MRRLDLGGRQHLLRELLCIRLDRVWQAVGRPIHVPDPRDHSRLARTPPADDDVEARIENHTHRRRRVADRPLDADRLDPGMLHLVGVVVSRKPSVGVAADPGLVVQRRLPQRFQRRLRHPDPAVLRADLVETVRVGGVDERQVPEPGQVVQLAVAEPLVPRALCRTLGLCGLGVPGIDCGELRMVQRLPPQLAALLKLLPDAMPFSPRACGASANQSSFSPSRIFVI